MPSVNAAWNHGKRTLTFGGNSSYTQLNAPDKRTNTGMIGFTNFATFLTGSPITYTANGFISTDFLQGDADRYNRSKETGWYLQDKIQVRSNLSITAGLRFDHHGGLTEKMDAFSISIHHGTTTTPQRTPSLQTASSSRGTILFSDEGRQRFDSDRTTMGLGTARRFSVEPEAVE